MPKHGTGASLSAEIGDAAQRPAFGSNEEGSANAFDSTAWDPVITYEDTPPFMLDETITAMNAQQVSQMDINVIDSPLHHDGSAWSEPGLGGRGASLGIGGSGDHNDIAYSKVTGKYYQAIVDWAGNFTEVHLIESPDLVNWTDLGAINAAPESAKSGYVYYVSIVNADGSDNGEVGRRFHVYFARTDAGYLQLLSNHGGVDAVALSQRPDAPSASARRCCR
jgi:hypothetical protein